MGTESAQVEAPKQQPTANVDEETVASNPLSIVEELVGEVTSRVASRKALIDLEEKLVAIVDVDLPTDLEEEPTAIVDTDLPA